MRAAPELGPGDEDGLLLLVNNLVTSLLPTHVVDKIRDFSGGLNFQGSLKNF